MKKSLFLLGVTAAVLSGCSNQEVMDVADYANQPIKFSTFVDKTTRSGDVAQATFRSSGYSHRTKPYQVRSGQMPLPTYR